MDTSRRERQPPLGPPARRRRQCGQLYDVRRVACGRNAAAVKPIGTLNAPTNASEAVFAAQGSTLVVGGGSKCGGAAVRGERAGDDAAEEEEEEVEKKKPAKEKKKRQAKKEMVGSRQSRMA